MSHDTEPLVQTAGLTVEESAHPARPDTPQQPHQAESHAAEDLVLVLDESAEEEEVEKEVDEEASRVEAVSDEVNDQASSGSEQDTEAGIFAEIEKKLESEDATKEQGDIVALGSPQTAKLDHSYTLEGSPSPDPINNVDNKVSENVVNSLGDITTDTTKEAEVGSGSQLETVSRTFSGSLSGVSAEAVDTEPVAVTQCSKPTPARSTRSKQQSESEDEGGRKKSPTRPCALCGDPEAPVTQGRRSKRVKTQKEVTPAQSSQAQVRPS